MFSLGFILTDIMTREKFSNSYGIIVYEVLTRIQAYSDSPAGRNNIVAAIGNGTRPNHRNLDEVDKQLKQHQKQDHEIFLKLQSLMKECWQQEPTKRPKATEILETTTQQMDELPAMEGLDMEDLTHELTVIDGSDMEVSTMDDSDGKTITSRVDELPVMDGSGIMLVECCLISKQGGIAQMTNIVYVVHPKITHLTTPHTSFFLD
uniref:uncharacterized protein LOC104266087 isoform X2 n=1 Tax=Ciona intestinalis TaxID=7719 RepID=UPI00089DCE1C|nr:uncharacterized protein LOC104266087 isoform X2 [Ciona intestinalis]|eukprot:XP_009859857.2 uncharacterized protein LOC104266087 isoform X2 [Ciona intestinalis]